MPIFDYLCEDCGWVYSDVYRHNSVVSEDTYCRSMTKRRIIADTSEIEEFPGCESKQPLLKLIGAPADLRRVNRAGKFASESSKQEEAHATKKQLLKRSYDHEFKKGGKGVEERRARIEELKKQRVPIPGHHGF